MRQLATLHAEGRFVYSEKKFDLIFAQHGNFVWRSDEVHISLLAYSSESPLGNANSLKGAPMRETNWTWKGGEKKGGNNHLWWINWQVKCQIIEPISVHLLRASDDNI